MTARIHKNVKLNKKISYTTANCTGKFKKG